MKKKKKQIIILKEESKLLSDTITAITLNIPRKFFIIK